MCFGNVRSKHHGPARGLCNPPAEAPLFHPCRSEYCVVIDPSEDMPNPETQARTQAGQLGELPALELAALFALRSWCEGPQARDRFASDVQLLIGCDAAAAAIAKFDTLMRLTISALRRPFEHHSLRCSCFSEDERAFAGMLAAVAAQDNDTAMRFAFDLMGAGPAPFEAVRLASGLGPAFLRIARAAIAMAPQRAPIGYRLH